MSMTDFVVAAGATLNPPSSSADVRLSIHAVGGLSVLGVATLLTFGGVGHAGPDGGHAHADHVACTPSSGTVLERCRLLRRDGSRDRAGSTGRERWWHFTEARRRLGQSHRVGTAAMFLEQNKAESWWSPRTLVNGRKGKTPFLLHYAGGAAGPASAGLKLEDIRSAAPGSA